MTHKVTSATFFYLTVYCDRVIVSFHGTHGGIHHRTVGSKQDLEHFLVSKADEASRLNGTGKVTVTDLDVYASSALDFPEEFTSVPETVALAHALRSRVIVRRIDTY